MCVLKQEHINININKCMYWFMSRLHTHRVTPYLHLHNYNYTDQPHYSLFHYSWVVDNPSHSFLYNIYVLTTTISNSTRQINDKFLLFQEFLQNTINCNFLTNRIISFSICKICTLYLYNTLNGYYWETGKWMMAANEEPDGKF